MIQPERITILNPGRTVQNRELVIYWMQASQRSRYNHALEFAIEQANQLQKSLVVFFGLTSQFPEANIRHYWFMLEGLKELQTTLADRGIPLVVRKTEPVSGILELAPRAALIVVDAGYLRIQRYWRQNVAQQIDCPLIQVESDVIVPVGVASPKVEYTAATLRPKIKRILAHFLQPLAPRELKRSALNHDFASLEIESPARVCGQLKIDQSVPRCPHFHGGMTAAWQYLETFLNTKIDRYPDLRNDPSLDFTSNLSPYLHFGQLSPLEIALKTLEVDSPGGDVFLEELIIRRELSCNFTHYQPDYDQFSAIPHWARASLQQHLMDPRDYLYALTEFETATTHDPYWNAAQLEMVRLGKMHGYMRMYWGKKILEWCAEPSTAFQIACYLNNKYELDGRDPNAFTGVAWCFGKHDRPWPERPIFGTIRYMNANGLKRKFDADGYVQKIAALGKSTQF